MENTSSIACLAVKTGWNNYYVKIFCILVTAIAKRQGGLSLILWKKNLVPSPLNRRSLVLHKK